MRLLQVKLTIVKEGEDPSNNSKREFRFTLEENPKMIPYVMQKCKEYEIDTSNTKIEKAVYKPKGKTSIQNIKLIEQDEKPIFVPGVKNKASTIITTEAPVTNVEEIILRPVTYNAPVKSKQDLAEENEADIEQAGQKIETDLKNLKGQTLELDGVSGSILYGTKRREINLATVDGKKITIGPYDFGNAEDKDIKSCLIQTLAAYDIKYETHKLIPKASSTHNRQLL